MICACMSVGKPGNGLVVMSVGRGRPPAHAQPPVGGNLEWHAGLPQLRDHRVEVLGDAAADQRRRRG